MFLATKKKTTSKGTEKPRAWVKDSRKVQPAPTLSSAPVMVSIRCVYHSRIIVPSGRTPTNIKYDFEPGQTQSVSIEDRQTLLDLHSPGGGCCGGSVSDPVYYFSED